MKGSNIFITGATGFIGHYVAKLLLEKGHSLRVLARNPGRVPSLAAHPHVQIVEGDLGTLGCTQLGLEECDAVVHLALGWGETPLTMFHNDTLATVTLLEMASLAGVKKFIYTSSTAAMGKMRPLMDETVANLPVNLYGATKAASEAFVLGYNTLMKCNVIRPGYTFGNPAFPDGHDQPDRRFYNIASAVKNGEAVPLTLHDGTQFIHGSQQAELYLKVLESDLDKEIFLGLSAEWVSWREIAEMALELCPGTGAKIVENDLGWGADPVLFGVKKIEEQFGLCFDSRDLLREHVKWNLGGA
jgi:UDP-glucose 4-epimerase